MESRDNILRAHIYARSRLSDNERSDGRNAYEHAFDVANYVEKFAGIYNEEVIIIALLHDIVEDGAGTNLEIFKMFGAVVAKGVAMLTRDGSQSGEDLLEKLKIKVEQNRTLIDKPQYIRLIKCADKIDNLRRVLSIPRDDKRHARIPMWALETRYSLEALSLGVDKKVKEELDDIILMIEKHFKNEITDLEATFKEYLLGNTRSATSANLSIFGLADEASDL